MVLLYGVEYSREELLKRIGSIEQVGGVKLLELVEGSERGVRAALVRTGELSFLVLMDRGMDIANAEYKGVPLGWISQTGIVGPAFFEPEKFGWLRGFFGGLLTTCGLTYAGAPTVDEGEELGLHGRISYTPAKGVRAGGSWEGDDYVIFVEGEVREAKVFGPNMVLHRRIEAKLGERRIFIHDIVTNEGWETQPFMILYHFNIGFPIVDAGSRLVTTSIRYVPRDEEAWEGVEEFDVFQAPTEGFRERVYFHDMLPDKNGFVYAGLINERFRGEGIGVYLKYKKDTLHRFIEWKMNGEGTYVVGMEPANCLVMGRDKERAWGTLQFLKPQESREFHIEVGVLVGKDEIKGFIERVTSITGGAKPELIKSVDEFVEVTR
ncbi:MAG: aldose 1-epimerase family protein [Thermoprotei archaeon]|nr:aldose 1-epimerase family protein [Thermoprotei archaeon]